MEEDKIRELFENIDPEGKISSDRVEDFIARVKEMEINPPKDGDKIGDATVSILKKELEAEPDWRRRASIAAKIISNNLE